MTAVELQGAYNVRDLGGLRTRDGRQTQHGLIYRGDSLDSITPADASVLFAKLGIGAIIDLRTKAETELSGLVFPVPRHRFSVLAEGRLGQEPFPSDDPVELAKVYLNNIEGGRRRSRAPSRSSPTTCEPAWRRCSTARRDVTGPASWPPCYSGSSA